LLIALKRAWRNKIRLHVDSLLPKLDLDNASAQQMPFHPATALSLHGPLLFVIPSALGFPTSPISQATTYVVLRQENHILFTEATTLNRKFGGGERICGAPFVCPASFGSQPPLVIHRTLLENINLPFVNPGFQE
jgi:hypothetical protein